MNVLVLGNGGREHALGKKAKKSNMVKNVYVIPGNTGMGDQLITNSTITGEDFFQLENYCREKEIELIIVGNEKYLELGVVDYFDKTNIKIFGPSKQGAALETSKHFAKKFMEKYNIDTAKYFATEDEAEALEYLKSQTMPVVIKQDGLALGKGVLVTSSYEEAVEFIKKSFVTNDRVIFEEFLDGREFSLLCFVNGDKFVPMIPVRDYKRAFDNDKGLNTGGMGCYTPVEYVTAEDVKFSVDNVIKKVVDGLQSENIFYKGIVYAGLIKTKDTIKVIEFNARFGDPETEVLMEAMESDLIKVVLNILDNKVTDISWKDGVTLGVCMATKGYPQEYKKGYPVTIDESVNFYSMALNKEKGQYTTNGGRVIFVCGSGDNFHLARKKVYEDIKKVVSNGVFYREDIGKIE